MISTHSLDAYASQLWEYEDKCIEKYYVAWNAYPGIHIGRIIINKCSFDFVLKLNSYHQTVFILGNTVFLKKNLCHLLHTINVGCLGGTLCI